MTEDVKDFLARYAKVDPIEIDHLDGCGHCHHRLCMSQAAQDMINLDFQGTLKEACVEVWDRGKVLWENSKYFQLYKEEKDAGRDPKEAFAAKGWEM